MADFQSGTFNIMPQTQAQWNADTRVLRSDTVALVTDGPNKGKHKLGRGAPYTFADLDYVEDGEVVIPVVVVSGAGAAEANGNYYRNGSRDNLPMYRKGDWRIYQSLGSWIIEDADGNAYITTDSPTNPWDGTWAEDTLSSPPPTVSEGTETLTIAEALSAALSLT